MEPSWDERPGMAVEARCRLMGEVVLDIIRSDPELKLCEGLRLLEATRSAVARLDSGSLDHFEARVLPLARRVLLERFGIDPSAGSASN